MTAFRRLVKAALCCAAIPVLLLIALGCDAKKAAPSQVVDPRKRLGELYRAYLAEPGGSARKDLLESAQLLQDATLVKDDSQGLTAGGQAGLLESTYSEMFVLDDAYGDHVLAQADFVKARYWSLRADELTSGTEVEAAKRVAAYTPEDCRQLVNSRDEDRTHGRGPRYLVDIRARAATSQSSTQPVSGE